MATLSFDILTKGLSEEEGAALSPVEGALAAIGLYDRERRSGAVYCVTGDESILDTDTTHGDFIIKHRTEEDVLKEFWEGARSYDTFVTFNGRRFDVPYLMVRSAMLSVTPSVDMMEHRYLKYQRLTRHVDLFDQLTFYGAVGKYHSFQDFCAGFSIAPEVDMGVGQPEVLEAAQNAIKTAELYEIWLQRLAPLWFVNAIEI